MKQETKVAIAFFSVLLGLCIYGAIDRSKYKGKIAFFFSDTQQRKFPDTSQLKWPLEKPEITSGTLCVYTIWITKNSNVTERMREWHRKYDSEKVRIIGITPQDLGTIVKIEEMVPFEFYVAVDHTERHLFFKKLIQLKLLPILPDRRHAMSYLIKNDEILWMGPTFALSDALINSCK